MCTRFTANPSRVEVAKLFDAREGESPLDVCGEIFPKRAAYVIRDDGGRMVDTMLWGFPPPPASKAPVVNVRNLASPFWRATLAKPAQRCLVPVTSFCEWGGDTGAKVAHWFSVPSRPIFAFAGIWRATESGNVFAFLTCEPNPLVAAVHPRAMPVILPDEDYSAWLSGADAAVLAVAYPGQLMASR